MYKILAKLSAIVAAILLLLGIIDKIYHQKATFHHLQNIGILASEREPLKLVNRT